MREAYNSMFLSGTLPVKLLADCQAFYQRKVATLKPRLGEEKYEDAA